MHVGGAGRILGPWLAYGFRRTMLEDSRYASYENRVVGMVMVTVLVVPVAMCPC